MEEIARYKEFSVVSFPEEEDAISVIPNVWLANEGQCYWPLCSDSKKWKLTEMQVSPAHNRETSNPVDWNLCKIIIKHQTSTYKKAVAKMKLWIEESDMSNGHSTDVSQSTRYVRKRKHINYGTDICKSPKRLANISNKKADGSYPLVPLPPPLPSVHADTSEHQHHSSSPNESISITTSNSRPISNLSSSNLCGNGCVRQQSRDEKILKKLEEIQMQVNRNMAIVLEILQGSKGPVQLDEGGTHIPVCNLQELETFNGSLLNKEFMQKMVFLLGVLGGISPADVIRRILQKLISSNLAVEINWSGRGRTSIQNYEQVLMLVFLSVRKNAVAKDTTKLDIEKELKPWFRNARDRCGGRSKRMQTKNILTETAPVSQETAPVSQETAPVSQTLDPFDS